METSEETVTCILDALRPIGENSGLEFYPFLIGWYNEQVDVKFQLPFDDDTLAICLTSIPDFFEKTFLPYIFNVNCELSKDPLDQCMSAKLKEMQKALQDYEIDFIHDFEIHAFTKRPKVLLQTAGHVSAAAYYYQKCDVKDHPWGTKKIYGVSIHNRYGGWFAFRGVLICKHVKAPFLHRKYPVDNLSNEAKIKLLNGFNFHWEDWWYRDVSVPLKAYSSLQKEYFSTKPTERFDLIKRIQEDIHTNENK